MIMRVSHVEKLELPWKSLRCTKALIIESCTASSASSRFRVIRSAILSKRGLRVWQSASKASGSPRFASLNNRASEMGDSQAGLYLERQNL